MALIDNCLTHRTLPLYFLAVVWGLTVFNFDPKGVFFFYPPDFLLRVFGRVRHIPTSVKINNGTYSEAESHDSTHFTLDLLLCPSFYFFFRHCLLVCLMNR